MRISIDGAVRLGEAAWRVKLTAQETRVFGEALSRHGDWTVVVLDESPEFDGQSRRLLFDPTSARLLNLGTTGEALVLGPTKPSTNTVQPVRAVERAQAPALAGARGDRLFLAQLTPELKSLGERLLTDERKLVPGELKLTPSGKFVETPDNFWTVKIQPRARSLRITVRGKLTDFRTPRSIELSHDRGIYYSGFKLERIDDVDEAVEIILRADALRRRRRSR